jgi:hypothetical protein
MLAEVCLLLGAAGGDLRVPDPEPVPIVGGQSTEPGEFDSVHCLANVQSPGQIRVFHGDHTEMNAPLTATDFGMHPQFNANGDDDIFDYGYVVFGGFTPAGGVLRPITAQHEWDETIGKGGAVTLVGYGEDPDAAGLDHGIGEKRKVLTFIQSQSSRGFEFYAGGGNKDSCQGDSGGPAFVKLVNGTWRLAGVTSRGSSPCGQGGYYGAPYPALPWLRDQTGLDLCGSDCPTCDCLDMSPPPADDGCRLGGRAPAPTSRWLGALLLLLLLSPRPTRSRRCGSASARAGTPSRPGRETARTARAAR